MIREMQRCDRAFPILYAPNAKAEAMGKMMCVLGRGTTYAGAHGCGATVCVMVEITPRHISGKARR